MSSIRPASSDIILKKHGFTLIEVVLAIVLLMFVTMSLLTVFAQGYRFKDRSRDQITALFLAQYGIEDMKGTSWPLSNSSTPSVDDFAAFSRTINVTHNFNGMTNLDLVNVTVQWQSETGPHNITLTTLISNYTW